MIIDKLFESVKNKGHVCVGLDTAIDYIPEELIEKCDGISDALFTFNKEIIDATHDVAACYKVQIAYYEAYGLEGMVAYKNTLEYLRKHNLISIADIKRGDIAKTAEMYAEGHFQGDFESDFVTLNPYMGLDSIQPYLKYVKEKEKGLFVLVRTSNKGAQDIEFIEDAQGKKVYDHVGEKIVKMGEDYLGECGYSSIGGVMGCTHRSEGIELRKRLNSMFFLIPGYGAQGGTAEDVALYLKEGNGGIVNSSRGILLAYKNPANSNNFAIAAREEAIRMRDDILAAVKNS